MSKGEDGLKNYLRQFEENKNILSVNKKNIKEFVKSLEARGKAPNTIRKYLYPLYEINKNSWIKKSFGKATKKDIDDVLIKVHSTGNYSPSTKKAFRLAIKVFYKWYEEHYLEKSFAPNEYPDRVKHIITGIPKRDKTEISFNDMLTREEVIKMAQHTINPMHKALLWVAFESGGRPEEILNLRKSDVEFDTHGTRIYLKGVKSKRPVRLISSTEPMRDWLRKHPLRQENDFPVWVTQFSKKRKETAVWTALGNTGANRMLKDLAKKCNIVNKKITMYALRKGRATELAGDANISTSVLHAIMGWVEGSSISRHYVKISGQEMEKALLKASGIEVEDEPLQNFIKCSFCGVKNSPSALYCENAECGKALILGEINKQRKDAEIEELRQQIKEMRTTVADIVEYKMRELGMDVKEKVVDERGFMIRALPKKEIRR